MGLKRIAICVAGLIPAALQAQSVSPQVISTNGRYVAQPNARLEYTVGELVVTTLTAAPVQLTQGFHQPYLETFSVDEPSATAPEAMAYPNPTTGSVRLRFTATSEPLRLGLYTLLGQEVRIDAVPAAGEWLLQLSGLAQGTYYCRVSNPLTGKLLYVIPIQKISND